ncbi:hypothetical protein EVAR_59773_1 [Eumeta japonica]|uniref:Uncharacterized protein n=1 Tax=Eumeta variegata TaxID=151549 RepID=A0A4C1ZF08_EUMVA|nr:hypothetical protein EVAR_59773_1 [Eumeta japonica]
MEIDHNTNKEPTKRPAAARPSGGSAPPIPTPASDDSDLSEFTTVRRKASRPKPQRPAPHGSGRRIHLLPDHPVLQSLKRPTQSETPLPANRLSRFTTSRELEKTVQPTKAAAPRSVTDFRKLSSYLRRSKSLTIPTPKGGTRIPRRPPGSTIPTEEVKEDLLTQDLLAQSVRRITTNRA